MYIYICWKLIKYLDNHFQCVKIGIYTLKYPILAKKNVGPQTDSAAPGSDSKEHKIEILRAKFV